MHRFPAFLVLFACAASAQTFRLVSEKKDTYGISGKSEVFTAFDYDSDGQRIAKRAFAGADTGGTALGTTTYRYDGGGRLIREVTANGPDTVTDAAYEYGLIPKPIKVTVRGAAGKLRYTDTSVYDGSGNLLSEERKSAAGIVLFDRHYGYDGGMRLIADTLFETDGVSPQASQMRALFYNGDGTVSREDHSRFADGAWFLWEKVMMAYAGGKLVGVTAFEGAKRMDSLAIAYDGDGNRSRESRFDEDGTPIDDVYFSWLEIPASIAWRSPAAKSRPRGIFTLDGARFDLQGRRLIAKPKAIFLP
jgi:hypothetical protein